VTRTPWGNVEELRARKLPPGPGTPREEVARNQRERLFGAMVVGVAEHGYEATSLADLTRISGVSRSSFYAHFTDKRDCFLATARELVEMAAAAVVREYEVDGPWEVRARKALEAMINLLAVQPAAAKLCLVDLYAAGEPAIEIVDEAFHRFESVLHRAVEGEPERAGMPVEVLRAMIGGVQKVAHTRLYRGEEGQLPDLVGQLWDWLRSYYPPPQRLRARRGGSIQAQAFAGYNQMERIGHATAAVVVEKGYAATGTQEIAERASISLSTFYAHFDDKEEAVLAALELSGARMLAAIGPNVRRAPDWRHAVKVVYETMCAYVAAEPAFGQLAVVEAYAAGPRALAQRDRVIDSLQGMLAPAYEEAPSAPAIAAEAIAGAVYALLYDQIRSGGPESLPQIAPLATYMTLTPFLGPYEAAVIANDDGRRGTHSRRLPE
jgi:AcrR family transcriptional regulator